MNSNPVQKIKDYHGNEYLVNLEEDEKDIFWAVKYEDHGDEFVLVCTNDNKVYCYGYWEDRYHFGSSIRKYRPFAKKTSWNQNPFLDKYGLSLTWDIEYAINHCRYPGDFLKSTYQSMFNDVVKNLITAYNTGYEYNWIGYKDDIKKFLEVNDINTEKNLSALENAPWTSFRIDDCLGIAAKEDWSNRANFSCDDILFIFYKNQWCRYSYKHPRALPIQEHVFDDWGIDSEIYSIQKIKNYLSQQVLF